MTGSRIPYAVPEATDSRPLPQDPTACPDPTTPHHPRSTHTPEEAWSTNTGTNQQNQLIDVPPMSNHPRTIHPTMMTGRDA